MTELIVPEGLTDGEISLALSERIPMRPRDLWTPLLAFRIICCEDGLQAGRCDIRFTDNELIFYAGHIGYMVYPDYRGRHYAEKACRLLARVALANGWPSVVITCDTDNIPSKKTCENLGCTLLGEVKVPRACELFFASSGRKYRYEFDCAKCVEDGKNE